MNDEENLVHDEHGQEVEQEGTGIVRKKGEDGEEGIDDSRHKRADEDGKADNRVRGAQQDTLDVLEQRRGDGADSSGLAHSVTAGRVR
ncbi:hypothetical protein BC831DRAFT_447357, partial [Entophlyctis helioformis]